MKNALVQIRASLGRGIIVHHFNYPSIFVVVSLLPVEKVEVHSLVTVFEVIRLVDLQCFDYMFLMAEISPNFHHH